MSSIFTYTDLCQRASKDSIFFSTWMDTALYAPHFGYYETHALGQDFITAPMLHPLFAHAIYAACTHDTVAEFGAGGGQLARHFLSCDAQKSQTIQRYYICEQSSTLITQQKTYLKQHLAADIFAKVHWCTLADLQNFRGCIIGNEVLDALGVDLWCFDKQWYEKRLRYHPSCQTWRIELQAPDDGIPSVLQDIEPMLADLGHAYHTEVHPRLPTFLRGLSAQTQAQQMIFLDYGFLAHEYYHPQRQQGTLLAYHQHKAIADIDVILAHAGQYDISAHVNFSVVLDQLEAMNWRIDYFSSQAHFLMDFGLLDGMEDWHKNLPAQSLAQSQQGILTLMSEAEMGQLIQAVVAVR